MNSRREHVAGVEVTVHAAGDPTAPPMVLLHGGGLMGATWGSVCSLLGDRYHYIAPDLRGHGDTDWHPDGRYTLEGYAEDLRRLLDHLGIRRPHLVGMSLGGQTALHAACHGLEVASLTLVDVGPRLVPAGGRKIRDFLGVVSYPSFDAALDNAARFSPLRSRDSLARSLARSMRQGADGSWTWKWDPRRLATRDARAAQAAQLWPLLDRLTAPVLVVRGAESEVFSAELAEEFVDALRAGGVAVRMATVPGAGHAVQTDQPTRLAEILDDFLHERTHLTGARPGRTTTRQRKL